MGESKKLPYTTLGATLRAMRLRVKESVVEVSSAIEVTSDRMSAFENGEYRPTEDVLELIISHYNLSDKDADKLWDLAGYSKKDEENSNSIESKLTQQIALVMPVDARVVYTDMVQVLVNDYGVIVNFMQGAGPGDKPMVVSRVGMSRAHAESVLAVLQKTLQQADAPKPEPKRLNAPDSNKHNPQQ